MNNLIGGLFNFADNLQVQSMNQRLVRNQIISSNIANAETPGFRALGYSFEEQLKEVAKLKEPIAVKVSHPRHLQNAFTKADGTMYPDVFVRPTETIPEDGNTVDIDHEMGVLSKNHIQYRASVELINRKIGMLRYAITNGGR